MTTTYTAARIVEKVTELYAGESIIAQLVNPDNKVLVSGTSRAANVIKDFVPMTDGTVTALTRNTTAGTANGAQSIIPVNFNMLEYGHRDDAVQFPWHEYLVRAEDPGNYEKIVLSRANKAITAIDLLGTAAVRDTIGGGANTAYTHPLGPNDLGGGTMGFASPLASRLVRYGTQASTRANRNEIRDTDTINWNFIRSMKQELRARRVRPIMYDNTGSPVYMLIAHGHLITDMYASLAFNAFPSVLDFISSDALARRGIGASLFGMFEGVMIVQSDRFVYPAAGFGASDVYPAVMVGGDFLAKASLDPGSMPAAPANGDMIPVGDGACVLVSPLNDIHSNRLGVASWFGYLGYGIYDPRSYVRLECASTSATRF